MSAAWLAAIWLCVGTAAGLISRRLGGRRAVSVVALLLLAGAVLLATRSGAGRSPLIDTGSYLSREGGGLLVAAAVALALCLLLAETVDGFEVVGIGAVGAAVVLVVSTTSPLLYGVAAFLAVMALSLRWMAAAPGAATLAAGRVAGVGAASPHRRQRFPPRL